MRIALLVLAIVLIALPTAVEAQGIINGCVTAAPGDMLNGTEVVASNSDVQQKTIADSSGCYQFNSLPAGTYSVTAHLVGFVTGSRLGVTVVNGQSTGPLDFVLCLAQPEYIDWVNPGGLNEMWKRADIVAYVRIVRTGPVRSECPTTNVEHTASIIEILKSHGPIGKTITFVQENWFSERTPYGIGQEMFVFLIATPRGFSRLAGPQGVFLVRGHEVLRYGMTTPTAFLAKLRALAKEGKLR